jgi:hypothetical protein
MKKRILMIVLIIMGMLLTPSYLHNGRQIKDKNVHCLPGEKLQESAEDFNLTFPGMWFLFSYVRLKSKGIHRI